MMASSKDTHEQSSQEDDSGGKEFYYMEASVKSAESQEKTKAQLDFERRTMRFIDWRMLPFLAMMHAFSIIDRINLGAARTAGMGADLNLQIGARFSIASCLYFIPYVIFQVPANIVLRRLGVRIWLTFLIVSWGAVQLGMGFVPSWGYLTLCRILLGLFEAGFFPGLVYVISTWYQRHEVQKRLAIFYLIAITIGGFSPILAYVFSLLDGQWGIPGWQWIFIIEGALTLVLGASCWFFIPDFPDTNRFLTPEQTALVLKRIEEDRGDSVPDTVTLEKVIRYCCDWTLWAYGFMFLCSTIPAYALSFFISIILKGMGWSTTASLLLSAPPYGPAVVTTMIFSYLSDKQKHRGAYIIIQAIMCLVGVVLMAFAPTNEARYFGTFLANAGNAGTIPGILAYASNNVVSHSKRSVQSALTVAMGGVGGIIASTVFRQQDSPRYLPGLGVTIGSQVLMIILYGVTHIHFRRLNRLSREGKLKGPLEGQPGFFYTL